MEHFAASPHPVLAVHTHVLARSGSHAFAIASGTVNGTPADHVRNERSPAERDRPADVLDFAGFRFDPERGLFRAGRQVRLSRKELRGLYLLLARRGAVVSRDEYVQAVWPGGDASDDSIARSIYLLRRVLGLHGGEALVETVYGVGYRMTAPVSVARTQVATVRSKVAATEYPAAFETFQRARELVGRGTRAALEAAVCAFERAAQFDPGYACAWAAAAERHVESAMRGYASPPASARAALVAIERALAIDPDHALALAARGWVCGAIEGRFDQGLADLGRAIALDPCSWLPRFYRAWLLPVTGRWNEALHEAHAARDLSPLHPAPHALVGWLHFCAGNEARALEALRAATRELHEPEEVWRTLALVAATVGEDAEARALAQRLGHDADEKPQDALVRAYVLARGGDCEAARRIVAQCASDASAAMATHIAAVHLALGDRAAAVAAVSRADAEGCPHRVFAARDPRVLPLGVRAAPTAEDAPASKTTAPSFRMSSGASPAIALT